MNHGSLFSGIGGFDLAAEWIGWNNIFHCEWNQFGQKVLNHYWPKAISYEDITKTDFTIHRGKIDILTGGFPCQPYSAAGKRLGKEDDRHLWPEMLRAIREIAPTYVVGENVRGLLNWNGGMVFDEVQADLEAEGYEVLPFLLPAAGVNAPHRRDRVWFIAYSESNGNRGELRGLEGTHGSKWESQKCGENDLQSRNNGREWLTTNTKRKRLEGHNREREGCSINRGDEGLLVRTEDKFISPDTYCNGLNQCNCNNEINSSKRGKYALGDTNKIPSDFQEFPTQSPICGGNDGLPTKLDGITFSKWRNESIKAYGNAIVPQVALQIFKAIHTHNELTA